MANHIGLVVFFENLDSAYDFFFFLISKVYSFKRQHTTKYTGGIQGS